MATLSVSQRALVSSLADYLAFNHDLPMDASVVEQLAKLFDGTLGFPCSCGIRGVDLRTSFRDEPVTTFLKLLKALGTPGASVSSPAAALDDEGAGPDPVALGSAVTFDVLAASTVTNTGGTVVTGDLGLSPGSAVTGFPPGIVIGTQHVTDTQAALAQLDLTTAYLDAAGRTADVIVVAGNLAGQTLVPGLYKSASTLDVTSGSLTLDAQGNANSVWIFQVASALNIGNAAQIVLAGGAQAKNIFWQVGSSATIGTTAIFYGTIIALMSITVNTGASVVGRLLARNAAVTLDTNAVSLPPGIEPAPLVPVVLPVLTPEILAQIQALIDYQQGNINLPIDSAIVDRLAKMFDGTAGFPCSCGVRGNSIRDSFRDEPIRTFLRLLIAVSDATVGA